MLNLIVNYIFCKPERDVAPPPLRDEIYQYASCSNRPFYSIQQARLFEMENNWYKTYFFLKEFQIYFIFFENLIKIYFKSIYWVSSKLLITFQCNFVELYLLKLFCIYTNILIVVSTFYANFSPQTTSSLNYHHFVYNHHKLIVLNW